MSARSTKEEVWEGIEPPAERRKLYTLHHDDGQRPEGMFNHAPKRPRKLLMHRGEIRKFANKAHESGLTLVPLRLYFNERGVAKVLIGLCRGKKLHDKREALKTADSKREMARAVRRKT
jgi:SsrA-binding protein